MVRVLRDFRRRSISPATRQRRAAVQRSSTGRHVPGKAVGWELQANTLFQAALTAEQAPHKVVGRGSTA
eukprot:2670464-Heterocapsa_arctica.AAC.1